MRSYLRPKFVILVAALAALLQLALPLAIVARPDQLVGLNAAYMVLWLVLFLGATAYLSRQTRRAWFPTTVLNVWLAWTVGQLAAGLALRFGPRLFGGVAPTEIASVDTYFVFGADPLVLARQAFIWALPIIAAITAALGGVVRLVFPPTAA